MKWIWATVIGGFLLACLPFVVPTEWRIQASLSSDEQSLTTIGHQLKRDFPDVAVVDDANLQRKLIESEKTILVDVRTAEEFAVSHLPDAIRVDPDAGADDLLAAIPDRLDGRDVVFYCSVGVRSTILAARTYSALKAKSVRSIANLSGGIFAWHNHKRTLIGMNGNVTDWLHPYDDQWGKMASRKDRLSFKPKPS